jgi:hypothetical protein
LHRRKTDNKVFYVGKGKNRRAWCTDKRNKHWNNVVDKHGFNVDIVFEGLSEQEAFQIEKDTILEMKYFGCDLTNMTDGGEGSSGFKQNPQMVRERANRRKGIPLSKEHRDKISCAQKGKPRSRQSVEKARITNTGRKQSEDTKKKRSETLKSRGTCNDNNTYCFFSKNNDIFIGTRGELAEYVGIPRRKFNTLFGASRVRMAKGWYVLDIQKLMILKELIK